MVKANSKKSFDKLCNDLNNITLKYNGNAIIYCRVSTKNQTHGYSLDSQEEISKLYCNENKYMVLNCVNEVCSAKTLVNQKKLLDIINTNTNIHLIINDPSRISRNLTDFTQLLSRCEQKNITIHFVSDKLTTNNTNDTKIILSSIYDAEIEIKTLSKRIKKSIVQRKRNKTYLPSIPKYGFQYESHIINNKFSKKITKHGFEQLIITFINKLYWGSDIKSINDLLFTLTNVKHEIINEKNEYENVTKIDYGNMKFTDIANFLNSNNIFRRDKKWSGNSISELIIDKFDIDITKILEVGEKLK
jgi:DNA invertase Pin-like site-specific DNA recombinase